MTVKAGKSEIRMGTVSGLSNAVASIEELKMGKRNLDFLLRRNSFVPKQRRYMIWITGANYIRPTAAGWYRKSTWIS